MTSAGTADDRNLRGPALVTGAARGLGRATAFELARAGADVVLVDICSQIDECPYPLGTLEELQATASLCEAQNVRVVTAVADVRDQASIDAAVERGRAELGPVRILVNNAGIVGPAAKPAHELSEAAWNVLVDVDLNGPWRCAKAVLPDMVRRRDGTIVNVASTAGLVAFPMFANYVAAKHGVIGLTRALALDYAPYAIRVNAVCPTSIYDDPATASGMLRGVAAMLELDSADYEALSLPHHPLGTLVEARDVAATILWLAGEASGSVTGAVIPVDGGFTVR